MLRVRRLQQFVPAPILWGKDGYDITITRKECLVGGYYLRNASRTRVYGL